MAYAEAGFTLRHPRESLLENLQSRQGLDSTKEKLRLLERRYDATRREEDGNDRARNLTLQSLKALIDQLEEEITRFEGRTAARHESN